LAQASHVSVLFGRHAFEIFMIVSALFAPRWH